MKHPSFIALPRYQIGVCWLCAWLLMSTTLPSHCQGIVTIGFDGLPFQPHGTEYGVTEYYESGMWFLPIGPSDPGNQFGRNGGGVAGSAENGTAYVKTALGDSLSFGFNDGSVFDLLSVDLAEYSTVVPDAVTVGFTGYFPNGGTIYQEFTTDGVIDGTGPIADFQTFTFTTGWTGLARVEVPGYGWSMDNLVIGVPEPTATSICLFGATILVICRRRFRGHNNIAP